MDQFQFKRVLVKLSAEELEERRIKFVKEGEEIDVNLICYPEAKVVKALERADVDEDNWPCFEYLNVTAEGPDGNYANLLLSARNGKTFVVKGEVKVDNDFKNRLVTYRGKAYKNLNGSKIKLNNVNNVSIGMEPITIWISSDAGWFEVKPADGYRPTYEKMLHVIGVFFLAIEDFKSRVNDGEKSQATGVGYDVHRVFENYMLIDGSGVTRHELVTACQESRDFLLEQLREKLRNEYWVGRSPRLRWTDCNFYRWVLDGCPNNSLEEMEHDPELAKILPLSGNSSTAKKSLVKRDPESKSQTPRRSPTPRPRSRKSTPSANKKPTQSANSVPHDRPKPGRPFHGQYTSPEFPNGLLPSHHNVDIITALACHSRASQRHRETTLNNLSWNFYWDYSCDKNQAAFAVVTYYAKEVAARLIELNKNWEETNLYRELLQVKFDTSKVPVEHMDKVVKPLTTGGEKLVHRDRKPRKKAASQPSAAASASDSISLDQGQSSAAEARTSVDPKVNNPVNPPQQSKKRKASPPPPPAADDLPPDMRGRDLSKFSWSRPSSPAPSEDEKPKVDFNGKPFVKRIKRAPGYSWDVY